MKNILNLGKKLTNEEQKKVKGGIGDPCLDFDIDRCKSYCKFDPISPAECESECEDLADMILSWDC
ncbi:conserved hypothetical protein [Tenacibaculum sp. 190524A05c]|uniref:hypothetical protein n=1 Tax=Tenacibaculum platacis TaxID=3137852 RepID=UPI0031FB6ACD